MACEMGIAMFQVHVSGPSSAHDLRVALETIKPEEGFLVRTESPALYSRFLDGLGFEVVQPGERKSDKIWRPAVL